jgi:hypothetical protein
MTHAFMYPRVTQIAPRAHSVPASSLVTHLHGGARDVLSGPTLPASHHAPDSQHPRTS